MYCSHCGKEIPDEGRFCIYCGAAARKTPAEPMPEQMGGRFAAAVPETAADAAETTVSDQFGGRFAAAIPIAEPVEEPTFAAEETASEKEAPAVPANEATVSAAEQLVPAETEILPAGSGETALANPKKKLSRKTLAVLLCSVLAVVLVIVLAAVGVFRPSDEKLMEKYTEMAAEEDHESIDELLAKASKWKRYALVGNVLTLEYNEGRNRDFLTLTKLLPEEQATLPFDCWYSAYREALYTSPAIESEDDTEGDGGSASGFESPLAAAAAFGSVCDDFYRSGILSREELISLCTESEDFGDDIYGVYMETLGGNDAGKILPVYYKSWADTACVNFGLLAALPQELRADSYADADYVLECYLTRSVDGYYRLGGTAYSVRMELRIVDLAGEVLCESDTVWGGSSPNVISYIGDAYGSYPVLADYPELVTEVLDAFMADRGTEGETAVPTESLEQFVGTWGGAYFGSDGSPDTAAVTIEADGRGSIEIDGECEIWNFNVIDLQSEEDCFTAVLALGFENDTAEVEGLLCTDDDGDLQLEGIYVVYDSSGEETDRTGAFVLEPEY